MSAGRRIPLSDAEPGDLLVWSNGSHTAVYAGAGRMIHAPGPGSRVERVDVFTSKVTAISVADLLG